MLPLEYPPKANIGNPQRFSGSLLNILRNLDCSEHGIREDCFQDFCPILVPERRGHRLQIGGAGVSPAHMAGKMPAPPKPSSYFSFLGSGLGMHVPEALPRKGGPAETPTATKKDLGRLESRAVAGLLNKAEWLPLVGHIREPPFSDLRCPAAESHTPIADGQTRKYMTY